MFEELTVDSHFFGSDSMHIRADPQLPEVGLDPGTRPWAAGFDAHFFFSVIFSLKTHQETATLGV